MSGVWGVFSAVRTAKTMALAILLFVCAEPTPKCWAQNADLSSGTRMAVSRRASDGFLNVRNDPDPDASIVGRLKVGDQVVTTGKVVSRGSTRWYQVRGGSKVGWVNGFYLDKVAAVERAPAVAGYRSDGLEDAGTRWTLIRIDAVQLVALVAPVVRWRRPTDFAILAVAAITAVLRGRGNAAPSARALTAGRTAARPSAIHGLLFNTATNGAFETRRAAAVVSGTIRHARTPR